MKKVFYILTIITFLIDRYFKDYSHLPKTINTNLSFSLRFSNTYTLFIISTLLLVFLVLNTKYKILNTSKNYPKPGLFFISMGAFSNVIDRFIYGGVVDYLDFFGLLKNNLSDYLIFFGIIFLFKSTPAKPIK